MGKSRKKRKSVLKRSTIVTMASCGSFVVMTFLALLFFTKFPVTPSEKIMNGIGRESIYRDNSIDSYAVAETTQTSATVQSTSTQTTAVTTKHSDFVITVTTGKGFRKNTTSHSVEYDPDAYVPEYDDEEEDENEEETTGLTDGYDDDDNYSYGYDDTDYTYDWEY